MARQDVSVELFYDGVWNPAPAYVRDPITINRGRGDESGELAPSTASLTLDNRTGDYNPRNASSALYGKIGRNTPIRIVMDSAERFYGEVASWRPGRTIDFNPTTGQGDAWTEIEAAGILRRHIQGADALDSPLRRAILDDNPTAYWPLEDLDGALGAHSPIDGVQPMKPFGYSRFTAPGTGTPVPAAGLPKFGTGTGIPGSAPVINLTEGGTLQGVPPAGNGTSWEIEWVMVAPRDKADSVIPIEWRTSGTWDQWRLQIESTGLFGTFGNSATGTILGSASATFNVFDGLPHYYRVTAEAVGGNTAAYVYVDGVLVDDFGAFSPPMAGSPGNITSVIINPVEIRPDEDKSTAMPQIGHVGVWQPIWVAGHFKFAAMTGHAGESPVERLERLCIEKGIDFTSPIADAHTLGPERIATFIEQLQEIERTSGGLIFEERSSQALRFRGVDEIYNQEPMLTLDYAASEVAHPLEPVVDDQGTRNDVTATASTSGATARAVRESGVMSVEAPPDGVGRYTTQIDVNPESDSDLPNYAGWYLHRGTVEAVRFPRVTVDLVASPALVGAVESVEIGGRIDIDNLPSYIAADDPAMIVLGYTEVIGSHTRKITFNTAPEALYRVAEANGASRSPAAGSTLSAPLSPSATSLSLTSTAANGPWTTNPANFPLDIRVGGEHVTASAITGTGLAQTVALSARGVNGVQRAWSTGTTVDVAYPAISPL